MMKVVLLGSTPPPVGGIAKWTLRMLDSKLKDEWELILVDERIMGREVFGDTKRLNYFIEAKRMFRIWKNLLSALKDKDAKIVHSCPIASRNSMLAEWTNTILAKIYRKKVILHFRCTVPNMISGRFNLLLLKSLCRKGDMIISLNKQTQVFLESITKTPVKTIPNFVDTNEVCSGARRISPKIRRVVYTGGVIKEKGCVEILQTAKEFPNIEFKLIGKASSEIEEMAKNQHNVILTGVMNNDMVRNELMNADVYMFLSYFPGEGFSNALAEAMAAGLPCIVSDWAANADMICDGKGGFVVPCKNSNAAIEALKRMEKESLRHDFSEYNRKKVINEYSDRVVLDSYVDYYNKLIERK